MMTLTAALATCLRAASWAGDRDADPDEEHALVEMALARLHRAVLEEPDHLLALWRAAEHYRAVIRGLVLVGGLTEQFGFQPGADVRLLDEQTRLLDELGVELATTVRDALHEELPP